MKQDQKDNAAGVAKRDHTRPPMDWEAKRGDPVWAATYLNSSKSALAEARIGGTLYGIAAPPFIKAGAGRNGKIIYERVDLDTWLGQLSKVRHVAELAAA